MAGGKGSSDWQYLALSLLATLLFIQALRAFFASVYYLNLVTLSINASALYTLLLFSPVLYLVYLPRSGRFLVLGAGLLATFRIGMNLSWSTALYIPSSGLAAATFLVLLPALLHASKSRGVAGWLPVGGGMVLAFAADMILLLVADSWDLSAAGVQGLYLTIPFGVLAILASLPMRGLAITKGSETDQGRWKGRLAGLSLGAWVFLEYAVLATPFSLSRWNSAPLMAVSVASVLGLLVPVAWLSSPLIAPSHRLLPGVLGALALVFVFDHTVFHSFYLPLLLVPAQAGMALILFRILSVLEVRSFRGMAKAMLYSSLILLLLVFIFVFTLSYGYVPMRFLWEGSETVMILGAALLVVLAAGILSMGFREPLKSPRLPRRTLTFMVILVLLLTVGVFPDSPPISPPGNTLRVVTYNLHQGFNNGGALDPEVYYLVLRAADADIVALQESDTARLTSGNMDIVQYLATRLKYHSYYGPPTNEQSFGIALLSRYPILEAGYVPLTGSVDYRALLEAKLEVAGTELWVFVTHFALGTQDRQTEVQEVLARTRRVTGPAIIAGDFNSCPSGICPEYPYGPDNVYESMTAYYRDVWTEAGFSTDDPSGHTYSSSQPYQRIDYIFVSAHITVSAAERIRTDLAIGASDHLPVLAVLEVGP